MWPLVFPQGRQGWALPPLSRYMYEAAGEGNRLLWQAVSSVCRQHSTLHCEVEVPWVAHLVPGGHPGLDTHKQLPPSKMGLLFVEKQAGFTMEVVP